VYSTWIYLYLDNKNENSKTKDKDRITLNIVKYKNREQIIIDILKTFKAQKIEIYVSTKYQRLLNELKLKNWTAP